MVFNYFYTIVFLVSVLLLLNIINRIVFLRFVNSLPSPNKDLKINDLLDQAKFEEFTHKMDMAAKKKVIRTRSWLMRIIIIMFVVIVLIIIVGIFSFIK